MAIDTQHGRPSAAPLATFRRRFLDAPVHVKVLVAIIAALLLYAAAELTIWALGVVIYFVPAMVAWYRRVPRRVGIFILNLFLGWTFLGWVGALIWAVVEPRSDS